MHLMCMLRGPCHGRNVSSFSRPSLERSHTRPTQACFLGQQLLSCSAVVARADGPQQSLAAARTLVKAAGGISDAPSSSGDSFAWPDEIQPGTDGAQGPSVPTVNPSSNSWSTSITSSSSSNDASFSSSSSSSSGGQAPPWAARMPTWNASTRKHLHHMMDLFTLADRVSGVCHCI